METATLLIDSHVHLQDPKFARDLDQVLARAAAAGIGRMVCIADDLSSARDAIHLARRIPGVSATAGIHPHHDRSFKPGDEVALRVIAREKEIVAIGEIGLDFHYPDFRKNSQIELFRLQAFLASELDVPMVIHCREAYAELVECIRSGYGIARRGVVHCFSGSYDDARRLMDLGFYLGIGGSITYPNAGSLRKTIQMIGLERIVLETDAPYLPPQPKRGRRNEPSYMVLTLEALAEIVNLPLQEVARMTTENAARLYRMNDLVISKITASIR